MKRLIPLFLMLILTVGDVSANDNSSTKASIKSTWLKVIKLPYPSKLVCFSEFVAECGFDSKKCSAFNRYPENYNPNEFLFDFDNLLVIVDKDNQENKRTEKLSHLGGTLFHIKNSKYEWSSGEVFSFHRKMENNKIELTWYWFRDGMRPAWSAINGRCTSFD